MSVAASLSATSPQVTSALPAISSETHETSAAPIKALKIILNGKVSTQSYERCTLPRVDTTPPATASVEKTKSAVARTATAASSLGQDVALHFVNTATNELRWTNVAAHRNLPSANPSDLASWMLLPSISFSELIIVNRFASQEAYIAFPELRNAYLQLRLKEPIIRFSAEPHFDSQKSWKGIHGATLHGQMRLYLNSGIESAWYQIFPLPGRLFKLPDNTLVVQSTSGFCSTIHYKSLQTSPGSCCKNLDLLTVQIL